MTDDSDWATCPRCGSEVFLPLDQMGLPDPGDYEMGEEFSMTIPCPVEGHDGGDPMEEFDDGDPCQEDIFLVFKRVEDGWLLVEQVE